VLLSVSVAQAHAVYTIMYINRRSVKLEHEISEGRR